ncbi:MAG TPA: hypothetical protein VGN09_13425 [Vicinamibacteria bacterium]
MSYWTDIFTLETWAQAGERDFRTTGFPAPTPGSGGYSVSMFDRVSEGDVLLCYCKRPAGRWIGALRVLGAVYQSDDPVWGLTESGEPRYPWRFRAEPIIALDPAVGLPGEAAASEVGFLSRLGRKWGVYLQRSLNPIPEEDGQRLLALLREQREEVPIRIPRPRGGSRRSAEGPELTLLETRAVPAAPIGSEPEPESPEPRTHTEIQGKLRDIGLREGYDVWVADRGVEWQGRLLGEGCLDRIPVVAPERTQTILRNIDVIWFRRGTGHPVRFFEVEHSTSVYSGLLRFNDVMIDFPIERAFIVGDGERTKTKFEREVARRTFDHSGLRAATSFLSYAEVRHVWQRYQELAGGSQAWG